jgi:hypothetical protein
VFVEVLMLNFILRQWNDDPQRPKRRYRWVTSWQDSNRDNDLPLPEDQVQIMKDQFKSIAPTHFRNLFPE